MACSAMLNPKLALTLIACRSIRTVRAGFTLIEVLISVIVSGLIVSGLLFLVVEALQLDRREVVLNQVQGDIRRAVDYISTDIREAVYVYPPTSPDDIIGADTVLLGDDGLTGIPNNWQLILALWRLEPIDGPLPNCDTVASAQENECQVLLVRQAYYNLVAYFLVPNGDDTIWEGRSRIIRYTLPRYTRNNIATLTRTPGFNDPTAEGVSFESWTRKDGENTAGISLVLSDNIGGFGPGNAGDFCETETGSDQFIPSAVTAGSSFIACVTPPTATDGSTRRNQEVFLALRGDAQAGTGREFLNPFSVDSSFPPIKSRVLVRGVLNKPAQ